MIIYFFLFKAIKTISAPKMYLFGNCKPWASPLLYLFPVLCEHSVNSDCTSKQ